MVGAVLGSGLYLVFVQWHLPDSEINETNDLQFKTMDTKTVEKLEIIKNCRVELDPNKVAIGCPKSH